MLDSAETNGYKGRVTRLNEERLAALHKAIDTELASLIDEQVNGTVGAELTVHDGLATKIKVTKIKHQRD